LTVALGQRVLVLKVVQPGMRRGPYEEARQLYEEIM
jgi:ribosome-associated heat shock protein Hsp15